MFAKALRRNLTAKVVQQVGRLKAEEMRSTWIVSMFNVRKIKCCLGFKFNELAMDGGVIFIRAVV
jgi:hypothetical protein